MRRRILIVAAGAILCASGFAVAQNPKTESPLKLDPRLVATVGKVENQSTGQITLFGVSIQVNGVLIRADRAVVNQREVTLEGSVRLTLPPPK